MTILVLLVALALTATAIIASANGLFFPPLRSVRPRKNMPRVSLLVPARNEAHLIGRTVRQLLAQDVADYEVIVLDDCSSDGTAAVAREAGQGDPRLRVLEGAPLPQGWVGKVWACHQLAQAATGDILVFTDADVNWRPGALAALIARMARTRADLLSVWPTQECHSWAERLTVPLMAAMPAMGYVPIVLVHHTPWALFATANGQCLAFRRSAYFKIGGHAAVRDQIVEDVALARRIKRARLGLRLADGAGLITCRMYQDWPTVRDGFAKNFLVGHGDRLELMTLNVVAHWLIYVWPWLWLLFGWLAPSHPDWPAVPLALAALGVGIRALSAAGTRQRLRDSALIPISVLLISLIALRAIWWRLRYHGSIWKGRPIARVSSK